MCEGLSKDTINMYNGAIFEHVFGFDHGRRNAELFLEDVLGSKVKVRSGYRNCADRVKGSFGEIISSVNLTAVLDDRDFVRVEINAVYRGFNVEREQLRWSKNFVNYSDGEVSGLGAHRLIHIYILREGHSIGGGGYKRFRLLDDSGNDMFGGVQEYHLIDASCKGLGRFDQWIALFRGDVDRIHTTHVNTIYWEAVGLIEDPKVSILYERFEDSCVDTFLIFKEREILLDRLRETEENLKKITRERECRLGIGGNGSVED